MAWNRIGLFESDDQVNLMLQERQLDRDLGVNGNWWWEDDQKYTAKAGSDKKEYVWVLSGTTISIGEWQFKRDGREIEWYMRLSSARRSADGKLSVLVPSGDGGVEFRGGHFPGLSGFKNISAVTWSPIEFGKGSIH